MTIPTKPRRRWFAYSLRTLFVLLTVFGVWLGVQLKWIRDRRELFEQRAADERSWPPYQKMDFFWPPPAPWSLRLFGEEGVALIKVWGGDTPAENERMVTKAKRLFPEATVEGFSVEGISHRE